RITRPPPTSTLFPYTTLFRSKPHQEALGVAAAQGFIGLIVYIWILVAFVRAFWQGRRLRGAVALFAGWVAYVVSIQADFSWIPTDRKSTRLNSSHVAISYAVF